MGRPGNALAGLLVALAFGLLAGGEIGGQIGGFRIDLSPMIRTINVLEVRDVRLTRSSPVLDEGCYSTPFLVIILRASRFVGSVTAGGVTGDSGHGREREQTRKKATRRVSSCPRLSSRKRRWWYVAPFHLRSLFVN